MSKVDATAKADHGRRVHVHGYESGSGHDACAVSCGQVAIVLQSGPKNKRRYFGEGSGVTAYMTRNEAKKLHTALGRILLKPAVR